MFASSAAVSVQQRPHKMANSNETCRPGSGSIEQPPSRLGAAIGNGSSGSPRERAGGFAQAVLMLAMRHYREGDATTLKAMGLATCSIDALRELDLADLPYMEEDAAAWLEVRLNPEAFRSAVGRAQAARRWEELQRELIRADAPKAMMKGLFGMADREYAALRRLFGMASAGGRPRQPDEDTAARVWRRLAAKAEAASGEHLPPEAYLVVAKECRTSLRVVWAEARRFAEIPGAAAKSPARFV